MQEKSKVVTAPEVSVTFDLKEAGLDFAAFVRTNCFYNALLGFTVLTRFAKFEISEVGSMRDVRRIIEMPAGTESIFLRIEVMTKELVGHGWMMGRGSNRSDWRVIQSFQSIKPFDYGPTLSLEQMQEKIGILEKCATRKETSCDIQRIYDLLGLSNLSIFDGNVSRVTVWVAYAGTNKDLIALLLQPKVAEAVASPVVPTMVKSKVAGSSKHKKRSKKSRKQRPSSISSSGSTTKRKREEEDEKRNVEWEKRKRVRGGIRSRK